MNVPYLDVVYKIALFGGDVTSFSQSPVYDIFAGRGIRNGMIDWATHWCKATHIEGWRLLVVIATMADVLEKDGYPRPPWLGELWPNALPFYIKRNNRGDLFIKRRKISQPYVFCRTTEEKLLEWLLAVLQSDRFGIAVGKPVYKLYRDAFLKKDKLIKTIELSDAHSIFVEMRKIKRWNPLRVVTKWDEDNLHT